MSRERSETLRLLLPWWLRRLPADIVAVVAYLVVTVAVVFAPVVRETAVRLVIGLPFVLFVPGYALIAALFPEAGESPTATANEGPTDRRGIDGIERIALSFGLSLAVVPLLGLGLNFTPWGIRLVPIVVVTGGFSLITTAVAATRRWALPAEDRFRVPYRSWLAAARTEVFDPDSRLDAGLNVLLGISILLAVSSVAYAVAVPANGEQSTEFYVLTENETGDLVAADYPTRFDPGESREVVLGIGNQEHEQTEYTVVTAMHRVDVANADRRNVTVDGPNETVTTPNLTVTEREELDRVSVSLAHNETWHQPRRVEPTMAGEDLRLTFLLYRGDPPATPTVENAYRQLHLWVTVTGDGESATPD